MARPVKPEGERLVPVSTNVPADVYDAMFRVAQRRGVPVAAIARERIVRLSSRAAAVRSVRLLEQSAPESLSGTLPQLATPPSWQG